MRTPIHDSEDKFGIISSKLLILLWPNCWFQKNAEIGFWNLLLCKFIIYLCIFFRFLVLRLWRSFEISTPCLSTRLHHWKPTSAPGWPQTTLVLLFPRVSMCNDVLWLCSDVPWLCNDVPWLCNDVPWLCNDALWLCNDAPSLCNEALWLCKQ